VAEHLAKAMHGTCHGAYVDTAGNAVGHWGRGGPRVWLLGHIDTVPGTIDVRLVDGVLHGRGTVDAKGSFCSFVAAASRLPDALADRLTLTLIGAVGEEAPGSVGAHHAVATLPRPDLVVIGEPSGWEALTFGYKGMLQVELQTRQASQHSSVDEPTAAERVVEAYNAIRSHVDLTNRSLGTRAVQAQFDRLQLRLLDVSAADDGLEQHARARLGFRLPPSADIGSLSVGLAACAAQVGVECVVVPGAVAAYRGGKDGPLPAAFRSAIRAEGGTPRHKLKTGTSDMNVVASAWAVRGEAVPPMVAYGPGDSNLDHTPEERLSVAEYLKAVSVLERVLTSLAA
jgi:LysW-gamma-L-lysine carboxypeptidase